MKGPLFGDNEYTPNIDRITAGHARPVVADRKAPSARGVVGPEQLSGWTYQGHTHYLIVDDVDQIPDGPAMSGPYRRAAPVDQT